MSPGNGAMRPRVHVITLGVTDLERSLDFYRALGWSSPGVVAEEYQRDETNAGGAIVLFELEDGLMLSFYSLADLAQDSRSSLSAPPGPFSLGHLVVRREDVDAVLSSAEAAGATLTEAPRERPWGIYSGYFRDPDGHLWEIIWNPGMVPAAGPDA